MSDRVIVVGGSGYIGSRLCPALFNDGVDVVNYDAGLWGNVPAQQKVDVLAEDFEIPGDGSPVIYLASFHKEPPNLSKENVARWAEKMKALMVKAPLDWVAAGHPLVYVSSLQAVTHPTSLYAHYKGMCECALLRWGCKVIRFGTVHGGLYDEDKPCRPDTAINSALLGKTLTDDYAYYSTHIQSAVDALFYSTWDTFNGTVINVVDSESPTTGPQINAIKDKPPSKWTAFEHRFMAEKRRITKARRAELLKQPSPLDMVRDYYGLETEDPNAGSDAE